MAVEQYANDVSTTLSASITNSATSLSVTSASNFPTSGDFRIIIGAEILLVTAVSGTTFTVTRGVEGTTAVSHNNGDAVTHMLTRQSLLNLIRDGIMVDTFSNRPTAGRAGRLFIPSDNKGVQYRDNGSSWDIYLPQYGLFTAPSVSFYGTWVNQEDATYSAVQDFIRFTDPGVLASGDDIRLRKKTLSGTNSCEIVTAFRPHFSARNVMTFGHAYRVNSNGRILFAGILNRANDTYHRIAAFRYTDANTFAQNHAELQFHGGGRNDLMFLKTKWTTPNTFEGWVSLNGEYWLKQFSVTDANMSGVDEAGLLIDNVSPAAINPELAVDIYSITHTET